jgi:hypothetical protein
MDLLSGNQKEEVSVVYYFKKPPNERNNHQCDLDIPSARNAFKKDFSSIKHIMLSYFNMG